jgi:hypothetical protein
VAALFRELELPAEEPEAPTPGQQASFPAVVRLVPELGERRRAGAELRAAASPAIRQHWAAGDSPTAAGSRGVDTHKAADIRIHKDKGTRKAWQVAPPRARRTAAEWARLEWAKVPAALPLEAALPEVLQPAARRAVWLPPVRMPSKPKPRRKPASPGSQVDESCP